MILEFTQPFGNWKSGDITDQVSEGVGRALITQGTAKESTESAQLRATLVAETNRTREELLELTRTTLQGTRPAPKGPPGGQPMVETVTSDTRIDGGAPSGKRCLGEAMMCVFSLQARDTPAEVREWATNMLYTPHDIPDQWGRPTGRKAPYASGKVTYRLENGNISETVERDGVSITRTGTESISGGPTYGFAIKPDWSDTMFQLPFEQSVIEDASFGVPVGTALEFKWPALDQYRIPIPGQSASYAGFQLSRKGEITQRQYTDGAMSMIEYKITDLTAFTTISRDLDADAYIRIDAMINQILGKAFQWKKDYEFINGNGIGSPTGYQLANCTLLRTRDTASHIKYEDLVYMVSRLHPACWDGARWVANTTCIPDLVAIKDHSGAYVYQPNALIAQYERPRVAGEVSGQAGAGNTKFRGLLLGFPILFTEKVPILGTKGDLSLIHPASYGVATRTGLEIGMSEHFLFDTDTLAFRFKLRNDGKPLWRAPYIQSDGGTTTGTQVSPFIVLN